MSIRVNVFSPWGKTRSLKLDINPDITIQQFKDLLNEQLNLNAKSINLELENENAFGKILEAGSLKSNGCRNGDRVTLTSVDIEYGDQNFSSPAKTEKFVNQFDPVHSAHAWRDHDRGVNYEASCPTVPDRKVIINRGFGTFDWATDPLELNCSCCHQSVDPRTVTRVSVNHCEWTWGGITDDGEKLRDDGVTQDLNHWIIDGTRQWRKLFIQAIDPYKPEVKAPTMYFTCALCKDEHRQQEVEVIANRQFCRPCAVKVYESLEERKRKKEQGEDEPQEEERPQIIQAAHETPTPEPHRHWESKILLPGLGQTIELRKTFKPNNN
jgi:hypothetical protein